jgi:hypothetical protein
MVVDALDECSEIDGTRTKLLTELRSFEGTVSLLITSRDLISIARDFRETKRLDIKASVRDLRRYVERQFSRKPRLAIHVDGDSSLREEIVEKIIEKVAGM